MIDLANEIQAGPVSFHPDLLAADPQDGLGVEAGFNPPQAVLPGQRRTYTYYAHPEIGETTALVRDWGNVLENPRLGLYGAVIVDQAGSRYTDPVTGEDMTLRVGWRVDTHPPSGPSFRDFTLFIQEEDALIGTAIMPYSEHVAGVVGLNYRAASLLDRLDKNKDTASVFDSDAHGDPATPLLEAFAGDAVKIHVLVPHAEQAHVFTLEGHQWSLEIGLPHSDLLNSLQVGPLEAVTIMPLQGAGGPTALPGDYLYGDHREPFREAGLWDILRVLAPGAARVRLQSLK